MERPDYFYSDAPNSHGIKKGVTGRALPALLVRDVTCRNMHTHKEADKYKHGQTKANTKKKEIERRQKKKR